MGTLGGGARSLRASPQDPVDTGPGGDGGTLFGSAPVVVAVVETAAAAGAGKPGVLAEGLLAVLWSHGHGVTLGLVDLAHELLFLALLGLVSSLQCQVLLIEVDVARA